MALTNNNLEMIKGIAKNDIHSARKAALASLVEDTSKKNAWAVDYYRKLLIGNASIMMSNIPTDMQSMLVGESPLGFDANRYYVRDSDIDVIENIRKMKLVAEELALKHIPYKNTTLLYGPSGTGKTELAKYIAYKLNLPFFYISFVSTIDSYMGSTAKNIHKVFEFCNSIPCVLMLDEIDCVAAKRSSGGSKGVDGEIERTTITLMQELDKLPNHVTLIAATNRLDMIDDALFRRFSIKHEVTNMSQTELSNLVYNYLKATETENYVNETFIKNLISRNDNPGKIMPEIIKEIGNGIYENKKDELLKKESEENSDKLDVWEVSYIWKDTISAETEEDAIAIARHNRNTYGHKAVSEEYVAKRADFITTCPLVQNKNSLII